MEVLGQETDQKGSLVVPEKLRFDFSSKSAMSLEQISQTEKITQDISNKNVRIYAKEISLKSAKTIKGLRSVFDEVYPDPVRVISFGVDVADLELNKNSSAGTETSVEFCGGTHLHYSGHIGNFIISSEEAIAKGIRRIVALTGPEADKALKKTKMLENELNKLKDFIQCCPNSADSKEHVKKINDLSDDVTQATIPYIKKDELRNSLKILKKLLDDKERSFKTAITFTLIEKAKQLCIENPNKPYIVYKMNAHNNTKALDSAIKQVKSLNPDTAAMFFSVDSESKKIFCLSACPKAAIEKGLKANEWVQKITNLMGGKGGGKPESAQASGINYERVDEIISVAIEFAETKLS